MIEHQNTESYILQNESKVYRYSNDSCLDAAKIFEYLENKIGCTYLIYMYENLNTNEKFVYSSNWVWQNLLIGEKLINNCPIFLAAFRALDINKMGKIFLPWDNAPPTNREERNVCGIRSDLNIGHGFGYGAKGNGARESLAFGGEANDTSFHMNFITNPNLFNRVLMEMRRHVLIKDFENKIISESTNKSQ